MNQDVKQALYLTLALETRPGMSWGLGFAIVENPQAMEANKIRIVMFQRTGKGNPDDSDVRIAFQHAARKGLGF